MDMAKRAAKAGSSPRVRGAGEADHVGAGGHGIIPACAGSSHRGAARDVQDRDHPRVYGEQESVGAGAVAGAGSSPRVRGAAAVRSARHDGFGIIPACAGSRLEIRS